MIYTTENGFGKCKVVPGCTGFEPQILAYLHTGRSWNQNSTPANPLAQSILTDLAEIHQVEGEKWEIRVPTALTILQTASGALDGNGLPCACESEKPIGLSTGSVLTASKL